MSFKGYLSIATFVLIVLLLWLTRHELAQAWSLMARVNVWILLLFIPLIILNYFSVGEMIFSYLRAKGHMKKVSGFEQARIALETNFVNHVLPSGGASGMSYMTWRLSEYGIPVARSTIAQVLRVVMGFASFTICLMISVVIVTLDSGVNRFIILVSGSLVAAMIFATVVAMYALSSKARTNKLATWATKVINMVVKNITFGRKKTLVSFEQVDAFMLDLHDDYLALHRDKRVMMKPFLWSLVFLFSDIAMFFVAFWALGTLVNPASILIAYAFSMVAAFIVATPGGSGAFETIMVSILTVSGLGQGIAMAGTVLTRVIVLLVIIALGYVFYQHAITRKRSHVDKSMP